MLISKVKGISKKKGFLDSHTVDNTLMPQTNKNQVQNQIKSYIEDVGLMQIGSIELNKTEITKRDLSVDIHSKSKKNIQQMIKQLK